MFSLFKKEISGFFNSAGGYLIIISFLIINSLFIWVFEGSMNLLDGGYATLDSLFAMAPWVFLMLIPAITMRSFAEERKTGTLELLFTRPLKEMQIISAKYLASMTLVLVSLLLTLIWYVSIIRLGNPQGNLDHGGTWGSYIGLFFIAGAYAAIGIWCSSLTDNTVIAFILAAACCLFICYGPEQISLLIPFAKAGKVILSLSMIEHYRSMSRGVLDTRDMIYFLALIAYFMLLTRARLERRKI